MRVFDDLSEPERREIELENIQRKDLTDYERDKHLVEQGRQPGVCHFRQVAGKRSQGTEAYSCGIEDEIASALATSERTCGGPNNVEAVKRYPELQGMSQQEALAASQELDHLPERRATSDGQQSEESGPEGSYTGPYTPPHKSLILATAVT